MAKDDPRLQRLTEALEDHSAEGIAILSAEPSRFTRATLLVMLALVFSGAVWSFFGRADVIVAAPGVLKPDSEVRRFYAPIEGELIDIFIAAGQPVSEGDVLARLNARGAIQAASSALEAKLKLSEARREFQRFPERKRLMERQAEALKRKIAIARAQHEKRVADGVKKLAETQRAKLAEARGNLDNARRTLEVARTDLEKYRRLYKLPGGGGVSRNQVEEKRSAFLEASTSYELAQARLSELDFELSNEYAQAKSDLEGSDQKLTELQIEYESLLDKIQYEQDRITTQLRSAELSAEAASRISFDHIDEDNFLQIVAPVSGVITEATFTQRGEKVPANTPLGGIAPADARPIVELEIAESDRAFLRVGQPVKLKFNAFPYQRYGLINGTLEYLGPSTVPSARNDRPVYRGRVRLERDYFNIADQRYPLRYGMEATAEIVVRKRRLIDLALDPFRELAG